MYLNHNPNITYPTVIGTLCIVATMAMLPVSGVNAGGLPPGLVGAEIAGMEIPVVQIEGIDTKALMAEDLIKPTGPGAGPDRFAVGLNTSITPSTDGRWDRLAGGWDLWRVEIDAPGALSLNLRIDDLNLPSGSKLWLHDPQGAQVHGPFTQSDRDRLGGLSTPIVLGARMVVEVAAPPGRATEVRALISRVHHGYRFFGEQEEHAGAKQESCNIDVVCPEGDPWRDQIRSVAHYTIEGHYFCTGTLMNNTAEDNRALFLTADHCLVVPDNAHTVVIYWNFESAHCGDLSGGSLDQNQIGTTVLATWEWDWNGGSDFTLLELDSIPDPSFNVYYAGWDISGRRPQSATGIHHPAGDEKAISIANDPLGIEGASHWEVNRWTLGTTESGSSGSCLFDQSNGLCVGTLSGGTAACGNDREDWYGQIHSSWTGAGTPSTRLSDHLDPRDLGVTTLQGRNPAESGPTVQWLIPAAASTPGAGDSDWKTQVVVANPSAETVTATLYFAAKGTAWPGVMLPGTHSIPAKGTLYIDDPLVDSNPASGLMYVSVDSIDAVVSTRTYNLGDGGATFGQGIPGIPLDTAQSSSTVILPLTHSVPGFFHTNVGFVQTSAGQLRTRVTIHASSGATVATKTYSQGAAFKQINDVFADMGVSEQSVEGGWIEVESIGGSPAFWTAYASVIDDQTGDPTYVGPVVR